MDPHLFSLQNKKSWKNESLILIKLIYIALYPTSDMSASKRRRLLSTTLLPTLINPELLPQKRFAKAVDNKAAQKKKKSPPSSNLSACKFQLLASKLTNKRLLLAARSPGGSDHTTSPHAVVCRYVNSPR